MKSLKLVVVLVVLFTLIGAAAPASAVAHSTPCGNIYYVRWGDTLAKIAARCNSTVAILLRANPQVADPDHIHAGQRLNILPRGTQVPVFKQVKIYLIGLGNQNCGTPIAVVRNVRPTTAPLTAAVGQMLALGDQYYGESGLFNPLYQSNLSIQSVTLVSGKATIRLAGTLRVHGACHGANIKTVFDRTALQFSTVKSVAVFINGRSLIDILSEEP
jgi:LysM repeat protein